MLLAVPKVGRVKATKILNSCRVSPSKTFGGLSERQRVDLAGRLDRFCLTCSPTARKLAGGWPLAGGLPGLSPLHGRVCRDETWADLQAEST